MILIIPSNNPVLFPVCGIISTVAERIWFWFTNIVFRSVGFLLQMALVNHSFQSDLSIVYMCFYRFIGFIDPVGRFIWISQQRSGI